MESYSIVWGLDIGHSSIKAVKLSRAGEVVTVLGYSIEPISAGENVDRDEAVVQALEALATREEFGETPVIACLSGRQIFARTINIPVINKSKISKMVELEARQQIPGNFDEVRWDYHQSPSLDGSANDVALFAARQEIIDELVAKTRQAGINIVGISVTSLALYNFVRYDQDFDPEETIIILDVGAENTDLVVYKGDTVWIRNLGVSGNDITRAFMKKFRVSFEEAEVLKCQVGESRQADKIFRVIEGSLGELVSDVQRSLGFYKSQHDSVDFENVVVSGNTFKLPGLTQFMADRLGYAIITLVELERIKVDQQLERQQFLEDLQSLGVAMGLAMQGLGVGSANINLLPADLRLQSLLRAKRWAAIAILVIIPIAYLINYIHVKGQADKAEDLTGEMKSIIVEHEGDRKEVESLLLALPKETAPVVKYDPYGSHVGHHYDLERQLISMVEDIARDTDLLPIGETAVVGSTEDEDPALQPIYLESFRIDSYDATGAKVFDPRADRNRTVTLEVRVPRKEGLDDELGTKISEKLTRMKLGPAPYMAENPGATNLPPPDLLPSLFRKVQFVGKRARTDYFYYVDPDKVQADGTLAPKSERELKVPVKVSLLTYKCQLGPLGKGTP